MLKKDLKVLILPNIENIDSIFKDLNVEVTKAYFSALQFCFYGDTVSILHKGVDIKTFDFVWLSSYWASRDLAYAVQQYLDFYKVGHTTVEKCTSKVTDQMCFVLNNIPTPKSFYIENQSVMNNIDDIEKICGYPMIMKDIKGCAGTDSVLIKSRDEFIAYFLKRNFTKKFMFQSFIENEFDWGELVSEGVIVSSERSYPKNGEFRNNVGCKEVFENLSEVPLAVRDIALKAANIFNLEWSRSDIIVDRETHLPYLLEINRFPGITIDSTEVSGALDYISKQISMI